MHKSVCYDNIIANYLLLKCTCVTQIFILLAIGISCYIKIKILIQHISCNTAVTWFTKENLYGLLLSALVSNNI